VLKFITHRPLWVNILTGFALAALIFVIFIFSLNWCTHHDQSKTVPAVLGKSFESASEILENAGFEVVIQDSVYTDTTKPLTVIKQVPDADEVVKVNRTVYLTINRAVPPMVEMPNLVGYSYRSAEMALENANLQVGEITYKPFFSKNAVLEQLYEGKTIAPGTRIRMGTKIALVLADGIGNQQFPVPSLIGKTYCEARAILQEMNIDFGVVIAPGVSDTCNGYIWKQSPERFDEERKFRYIRSGQLMDVWLQTEKPEIDSVPPPVIQPDVQ
jgi:eukaryotic-like serine/threonine-protein kinase